MHDVERLKRELMAPGVELRETHISLVFLARDTVLKIKKPVDLGFLDFTELATRKRLCEREVELNRRLAPDVYRGVVPIAAGASGKLQPGAGGEAIEWAVEMRRLADDDCAQTRLQRDGLSIDDVRRIAETIAEFHGQCRCDDETASFGDPAVIERNVRENFEQTRQSALRFLAPAELAAIERFQLGFLRERRERLEARVEQRRVRDGHGDLRLEHCYLGAGDKVSIIDCIEFNDRFRYGDVASDIAFLAMDLAWHGRHDLSEACLAAYVRATDDFGLYGVVDFYESYRAFVRGKVNAILESDGAASIEARQHAAAQARKYFLLAEACAREPASPPAVYAVAGLIASGKSTVADTLASVVHGPVVDADRIRKRLAGVTDTTPLHDAAFGGHYTAEASAEVYAELFRRAEVVLESGRSVVLDASFRERAKRGAARSLARRLGVPFLLIECHADRDTIRSRLAQRAREPSISDGRLEMFDAFAANYEPIDELAPEEHMRVDTSGSIADAMKPLREHITASGVS
jgi:aminoglycoside phosphotransferase family enzyme/predicted kinase